VIEFRICGERGVESLLCEVDIPANEIRGFGRGALLPGGSDSLEIASNCRGRDLTSPRRRYACGTYRHCWLPTMLGRVRDGDFCGEAYGEESCEKTLAKVWVYIDMPYSS